MSQVSVNQGYFNKLKINYYLVLRYDVGINAYIWVLFSLCCCWLVVKLSVMFSIRVLFLISLFFIVKMSLHIFWLKNNQLTGNLKSKNWLWQIAWLKKKVNVLFMCIHYFYFSLITVIMLNVLQSPQISLTNINIFLGHKTNYHSLDFF